MADAAFESRPLPGGSDYGTIVVVGGGCYGSYYVRQLTRANRAGAISWQRLIVVDRDSGCTVASAGGSDLEGLTSPLPTLAISPWTDFFQDYLSRWDSSADSSLSDSIVPSPLMPHLLYEWVRDRARERWPEREITTLPLENKPPTPWESPAPDGTHYVSYATWMCPINCIEPVLCPHTRGDRTWTMPKAMQEIVEQSGGGDSRLKGPLVFHCTHRAYGVGMIPVAAVVDADRFVAAVASDRSARVLVATVSHCHGAVNVLSIR